MTPGEIIAAFEEQLLPSIEDVEPQTATLDKEYLVVSGRAAMPLEAVSWSADRSGDMTISDEMGATIGTLCLVADGRAYEINQMTRWQYTAYLSDAEAITAGNEPYRFKRDYVVIDASELDRYLENYANGAAIWGGYHHGNSKAPISGWRQAISARPGVRIVTDHHKDSFLRVAMASGPREQYLGLYQTIELLFDYITFRKLVKAGNDLTGFGKIMNAYQKSELDRLKSIIKEFCSDITTIAQKLALAQPYLQTSKDMFDLHNKDGNPLKDKWSKYEEMLETGSVNAEEAKRYAIAGNSTAFFEVIGNVIAYQIYRIRSSIAHRRVGEYILTEDDDLFLVNVAIPLLEEVTLQIFTSEALVELTQDEEQ
jgi:hypothetical protein